MYDQYTQRIYQLLDQYLATISVNNQTQANNSGIIAGLVEEIRDYVMQIPDLLSSIQLDTADIAKFCMWILVAFLSTRLIKWSFRI